MPVVRDLLTRLGFQVDERGFNRFDQGAKRVASTIRRVMVGVVGAAMVKAGMNIEDLTTEFTTLLRSAERANAFISGLREFATTTPFQLNTLGEASKTLLAFGVEGENVLGLLRMLGDTAGGSSQKLLSVSRAFGKIFTRGKTTMEEINILIDAGIPIIGELAKILNVTNNEVIDLVSSGQVTADLVNRAFRSMTSEGGLFFRGMERSSQTTSGLLSTFKDSVVDLAASFAVVLLPEIRFLTRFATALVNRFKNLSFETRKRILVIIGAILLIIPAIKMVIGVFNGIKAAIGIVKLLGNPVGLVILLIIALAVAAFLVIKNWDKVKAFFIRMWDAIKDKTQQVGNFFVRIWEGMKNVVMSVGMFFRNLWEGISNFFSRIWNGFLDIMNNVWESIVNSRFFGFLVGLFAGVVDFVKRAFAKIQNFFEDPMQAIRDSALWQNITDKWDTISSKAREVFDAIRNAPIWGEIANNFENAKTTAINAWTGIGDFISNTLNNIKETAMNVWSSIGTFITDTLTGIRDADIWDRLAENWQNFGDAAKEVFESIGSFFEEKFQDFLDFFRREENKRNLGDDRTRELSVATLNALGAARAGGGGQRNINVQSSVNIQVPQGTTEQQAAFLDNRARTIVREEFDRAFTGEITANPLVESF